MTSAVLYGTTSDNELRPVQVTDSGEFVTDGGGGGDWYENFYVGGTEGAPSISLLNDGSITTAGNIQSGGESYGNVQGVVMGPDGFIRVTYSGSNDIFRGYQVGSSVATTSINANGNITAIGDVYAHNFIDTDGYDLSKIGQALSTIHDVLDSVDDFQGLKNLLHHLLDNLKSDPTPPPPPSPEPPPEPPE